MKQFLLLVCFLPCFAAPRTSAPLEIRSYAEQIVTRYAAAYGIPATMLRAVIRVESNWHPGALSNQGAMGMMQLMPATAKTWGADHPYWIYQNIRAGTAYLAFLLRKFGGDWRLALAAYYAGPRVVEQQGLGYASPAVFRYVKRVFAAYRAELKKGESP
jgi:soluble lytic murein transglycosylase-like protein